MSDPFGTARIRERVLAGWAAAPVRLREDANAEEDLALGGYRDRLVVELAQNAADAATRAGVSGRLALTLREQDGEPVLVAANTGEPLTAQGVQSLATLRASAKGPDDGSVGRFGVGFVAVLAVSDEPAVLSRAGGVRFSRSNTVAAVAERAFDSPELAAEVRRRDGHLPVLRLPFAAEGRAPEGFDTVVVLPLRDVASAALVRRQLEGVDDALLLALPALGSIEVDVDGDLEVHTDAGQRWHVVRRSGLWTDAERAGLLTDRPTEERRQRSWQVLWALPRNASVPVPRFVHAPTPTDEPLSLPALLLAGFPLDPTRRHVAAGRLTDRLVAEAADAYADLLAEQAAADGDVLRLVPIGLPAGHLDGALREAVLQRLPRTALLHSAEHSDQLLRPRDVVALDLGGDDAGALAVLAPLVAGLVAAPRAQSAALAALGVERISLAEVIDAMPVTGEPEVWRARYAGLQAIADDRNAREVLAALPVPLADGRVVRGARGSLLPSDEGLAPAALATLAPFGLRIVHPKATHPLLARLGATPASARVVLTEAATRAAVADSIDAEDAAAVAEAVLSLVAAALLAAPAVAGEWADGELAWLADLALPDDEGGLAPAGALVLAESTAARLLDPRDVGVLSAELSDRWPSHVLTAVGVLADLGTVHARGVDLDDLPEAVADLADAGTWAEHLGAGAVDDLVAVRDLDLVAADAWPDVLEHLAATPLLRRAVVDPVQVLATNGARRGPSYTAWWLRRRLGTVALLDPAADPALAGLLGAAPPWVSGLDAGMRRALGLVTDLSSRAAADGGADVATAVLQRLSRPELDVDVPTFVRAWALVAAHADRLESEVPTQVRVLDGHRTRVSPATEAVVGDDPRWLQRPDLGGLVVVNAAHAVAVADLLDVPLASELAPGVVAGAGAAGDVPAVIRTVLPQAPQQWYEHDELVVDGYAVDWWVEDGRVHAATSDGLARALAWSAGDWPARHLVASLLADPGDAVRLLLEDAAG